MKRKLVIGCFLLLSFASKAQYFNIEPTIVDSIGENLFAYHVSGVANFNDSLILRVELLTEGDETDTLYSGIYNFKNPIDSTLNSIQSKYIVKQNPLDNSSFDSLVIDTVKTTIKRVSNFIYNRDQSTFSFNIGNFPRRDLFVHIWILQAGEIKNEIYYKQP